MHFEGRGSVTVKSEDDGPPLVLTVHQQTPGVSGYISLIGSHSLSCGHPLLLKVSLINRVKI
jgi:hypothetical protein